MFKREIKCHLKSFLVWLCIVLGTFLVIFLVYPTITNSENIKSIDEMMNIFPKEMLEMFNMDITSISTTYGWLKSEGFIFVLLIMGSYAGILGSTILLKEESDKTVEYLNSLPIKRKDVVLKKYFAGLLYVVLLVVILGIFNYFGLKITGDFDEKQYIYLSLTPILSSTVIYSVCLYLSTFAHKTKKVLGLSLGIVFISYILNALSGIDESVEFLKYLSIFTLADVRNVLLNSTIEPIIVVITLVLNCLFIGLTLIRYQRNNLV